MPYSRTYSVPLLLDATVRPGPRYFSWRALGTEFNEKVYPEPQLVHKGEEVATFEDDRDGLGLDRRGSLVIVLTQSTVKRFCQRQIVECNF